MQLQLWTQMDISFWTQSSPNIRIEHTTKQYYNQYLCKLVVYAPAGRCIEGKGTISDAIDYRYTICQNVNSNYGGPWWSSHVDRQVQLLSGADIEFLEFLRTARRDKLLNTKFRIEEPLIQIYGKDEDTLKELVSKHFRPVWAREYIESISVPSSNESAQILQSGAIIRRNSNGYRYKVLVKDGHYPLTVKESIRQYLQGLGHENVHVPKGLEDQLLKGSFIWSGYFYVNDPGILSFLQLISPGMVTNFHELVIRPHK